MDILKIIQYNCILQLSRNIKFYVTEEFVKAGYFTKNEKLTKLKIQSKGIDLIAKEIKFNSNIIYNSCLVIKNKNKVGISNVKKFLKNIKQKNNGILFTTNGITSELEDEIHLLRDKNINIIHYQVPYNNYDNEYDIDNDGDILMKNEESQTYIKEIKTNI